MSVVTGSSAATYYGCSLGVSGIGLGFGDRRLGLGLGLDTCDLVNITDVNSPTGIRGFRTKRPSWLQCVLKSSLIRNDILVLEHDKLSSVW